MNTDRSKNYALGRREYANGDGSGLRCRVSDEPDSSLENGGFESPPMLRPVMRPSSFLLTTP